MKLPNWIKKVLHLSRPYDVPPDHTWSKASMGAQRAKGEAEKPALDAEIDALIDRARQFIDAETGFETRKEEQRDV
jgi:hypothetical protein